MRLSPIQSLPVLGERRDLPREVRHAGLILTVLPLKSYNPVPT